MMQDTADSALVCKHGNVGRGCGFVVTCRARILPLGLGTDRRPEPRAWSAFRMSTACQLFALQLHLVSIVNKHSSKQAVAHVRKIQDALAAATLGIHKPGHEALLCRQDVSAAAAASAW
jgi:hypothetical protein